MAKTSKTMDMSAFKSKFISASMYLFLFFTLGFLVIRLLSSAHTRKHKRGRHKQILTQINLASKFLHLIEIFLVHLNNPFKQLKVRTIFGTLCNITIHQVIVVTVKTLL